MTAPLRPASWRATIGGLLAAALVAASCGAGGGDHRAGSDPAGATLRVSAIPDQDPELLLRSYDDLARYLEAQLPGWMSTTSR